VRKPVRLPVREVHAAVKGADVFIGNPAGQVTVTSSALSLFNLTTTTT
jgi:hypothetical protein